MMTREEAVQRVIAKLGTARFDSVRDLVVALEELNLIWFVDSKFPRDESEKKPE